MGRVVSEKGFKESVIFDEIIRRDECSEKPWHVYFEYGIRGDKWSKVKKGDYETEEEAKRMLEEFIRSFEELTAEEFQYVAISPGMVDIKLGDLSEPAQLLVDSLFVGLEMIAESYPDNVKVTKH